ncbi:MAG: hypothetical protein Q8P31_06300 [Bacillota bacterium]|nr:hypothetical protein [Bacillota bacterium]
MPEPHSPRTPFLHILIGFALSGLAVLLLLAGCGLLTARNVIGVGFHPMPVASAGLDLMAFVSTKGQVYVWAGTEAELVYTPPTGWAVAQLALSPDQGRPYLALTEGPRIPDSEAVRAENVTIVNVRTGAAYRAFPLARGDAVPERYAAPQDVYTLQWSADGTELFLYGKSPLVLSVGQGAAAASVVWDLSAMLSAGGEPRAPLMAPDFSRLAYSVFDPSGDTEEDLWVIERPASSDNSPPPRRLTEGNLGGYPVCWLGSRADGSDPGGEASCVLIQLGGVSTGGGTPTGLAVVDTRSGALDIWYPTGNLVHRPVLVAAERGRALVSLFHSITGRDGRLFWRPLDGRSPEVIVTALEDRMMGRVAVGLGDGSAVVLARQLGEGGEGPWEYWHVGSGATAEKIGTAPAGAQAYLLEGSVSGRALIVTVSTNAGVSQAKLWRVLVDAGKVEQIELRTESGR